MSESLGMMQGCDGVESKKVTKYIKIIRPEREVTIAELEDKSLYLEFISRLAEHDGKEVKHVLRLVPESWALMNQAMVVAMDYFELDNLADFITAHQADGQTQFMCEGGKISYYPEVKDEH